MKYSLETLEFSGLLDLVGQNARTPMGARRFAKLRPVSDRHELERHLALIAETIALNEERQVSWSFSGLVDPTDALSVLRIRGSTLEPLQMLDVAAVCTQALLTRAAVASEREFVPTLWTTIEPISPSMQSVIDSIKRKLMPGGEIDDSASAELGRLRREINNQRNRLTKSLEAAMRAAGDAIQDAIVTMRNDRFVIPVKSDFRGKVGGVAHGFSSSGATAFIEPLETIEANNELQNLRGQEEREVARILSQLTDELRGHLQEVEAAVEAVAELDFVAAKVEFARKFRAVVPEISKDETLELIDARHPLLEERLRHYASESQAEAIATRLPARAAFDTGTTDPHEEARGEDSNAHPQSEFRNSQSGIVASSFTLTREKSVMIISGANAGGKTVVLKTAGLLSLMAVCGLPVPARSAVVPFYNSILADIGDHQSLSANLSTFSSHMSNIAAMINECSAPSLVLLDEAGTGTDPEEGSALGVAIVDHFRRSCGAHIVASTHYRGLKMYAANDDDVVNASVEFDEKTLQPTYRLLIGLAGASSGIEIASRFGIRPEVIEHARENLDVSAQEAERYLRRLQDETKQAEDLRKALEDEREAVAMKYAGLEIEAGKKEKERQKIFESELSRTIDDFDRQSKAFIKSIEDKALKNKLDKERGARKAELNRAVVSKVQPGKPRGGIVASQAERRAAGSVPASDEAVKVGSRVITSFGNVGTVEKIDKEVAEVLVGGMRLREKIANLQTVAETGDNAESRADKLQKQASNSNLRIDTEDAASELNLIGKTTADAEYEIDRFLDEAYMASLPRVRIIHGFGTGALKNFVHYYLKNHELIERFAFAPDNQGGHGATVAEIKP